MIEFNKVFINNSTTSKLVKKLSKIQKITTSKKIFKIINFKILSFFSSNTRLAFTKIGFSYPKLIIKNYWLFFNFLKLEKLFKIKLWILTNYTFYNLYI